MHRNEIDLARAAIRGEEKIRLNILWIAPLVTFVAAIFVSAFSESIGALVFFLGIVISIFVIKSVRADADRQIASCEREIENRQRNLAEYGVRE